jgi:hypothetical protein
MPASTHFIAVSTVGTGSSGSVAVRVKRLREFRVTVCQGGLKDNHASLAVSAIALFLLTP